MNRSFLTLIVAAPLFLAACQPEPTTPEVTPVVVSGAGSAVAAPPPGGEPVVVAPGAGKAASAVVVNPTELVSTNLAALAGSYDVNALACRRAPANTRVTIAASSMTLGDRSCTVTDTARDGSALRASLACEAQGVKSTSVAIVTPAAQGITLRDGNANPTKLMRCDA